MTKKILMAGAAVGLALAAASTAQAQSIDYGSLQALFGEPVTTSATGSPQRSTEAPADMTIISADEIRRSGEINLPGIIQRVAGIDVINGSVGQTDVNVRGYDQANSPRLLVLVNGRQVYQDHYGTTDWSTIPVELGEIRQIEVVRGPNAALFGFNAVSGVINIITYNPKFDNLNTAQLQGGINGERQGSAVTTFKVGQAISVRLSAGGQAEDEWKRQPGQTINGTLHDFSRLESNADVVAQLSPKTELRLEGSWSNSQHDGLSEDNYVVNKTVTTSEKATLISDTRFGLIQASAYQNQLALTYWNATPFTWHNDVTVASLQDLFKLGASNTFRIDGEYRHNTINTTPFHGGRISYDVWSASGMWNWEITPQVTTTTSVRIDNLQLNRTGIFAPGVPQANNALWDRTITEPSVNFTAAWRPSAKDTFRLSYARGVQVPGLSALGAIQFPVQVAPGFTFDLIGNPLMEPTIVTNYEASYDRDLVFAKVGLRIFLQDWKNMASQTAASSIDFFPTATTNIASSYLNGSSSQTQGAEFTATGKITDGLNWRANYTYTHVKDSPYAGVDAAARGLLYSATTPKYRGNVGLDWERGPWEVDGNVHFVGTQSYYNYLKVLSPVNAYASLSSRVGYKFDNGMSVALSGQNLLQDRQKQTTGLEVEREVQFTVTKAW